MSDLQVRLLRLSWQLCRGLSKAFPTDFRQEWGEELLLTSRRLLQSGCRQRGLRGLFSSLLPLLLDTLRRIPAEHWRSLRRKWPNSNLQTPGRRRNPRSRGGLMDTLMHDLRSSLRSLARNPAYALVALLTLTLAMAANTTVFSLVDAVLLKPLPFAEPDRLVALWDSNLEGARQKGRVSGFKYLQWKEQSRIFDRMALYQPSSFKLRTGGDPVQVDGSQVTEDFFSLLGVQPVAGRLFLPQEFSPSADPVVLLSHAAWQHHFGGDPGLIGRSISLDEGTATVVGVMPAQIYPKTARHSGQLEFLGDQDFVWAPMTAEPSMPSHIYGVLARLRPKADLAEARAEMDTVAARLAIEFPSSNKGRSILVEPLREEAVGAVQRPFSILLGSVAFVLLIACVNVANLTLVRAEARRKELAVRSALGAGRTRLLRQFLTEGTLLSLTGGLLGSAASLAGVRFLPTLGPQNVPRLDEAVVDARVLIVTFALCLLTGIVFGIVPTLQTGRGGLESSLREGGRTSFSGRPRARRLLVAVETALAVVLVIGAGLLIQSFQRLTAVDPGFVPDDTLTIQLLHNPNRYQEMHQLNSFYDRLLGEIEALPGVESAAAGYDHPLTANWTQGFRIENAPPPKPGDAPAALFRTVTPGYFRTVGIRLVQGRFFNEGDDASTPGAAIVNQSFVRRFLTEGNPLGRHFLTSTTHWVWKDAIPHRFEIVGVVGDVKFAGPDQESQPAYYIPFRQTPQHQMTVVVRTHGNPEALLPAIRQRLRAIDPEVPVLAASTMQAFLSQSVSRQRFSMLVLGAFAAAALLLALIGLWGVLSDSVRRRGHEIGVRMALGAGRGRVFRLMVLEGLQPAIMGAAVGIGSALALNRLLSGMLFEVSTTDPATYLLVPVALLSAALAACALPARRASRTDPIRVLRQE